MRSLCAESNGVTLTKPVNFLAQQEVDSTDNGVRKLFARMGDRVRRVALAGKEREYVRLEQVTAARSEQLVQGSRSALHSIRS